MNTRHWAQLQEFSLLWGIRLLFGIYRLGRHRLLKLFLYPVVTYYWLFNAPARRASLEYLKHLSVQFPELNLSGNLYWSYQHFISFAHAIIDKLAAWTGMLTSADIAYQGKEQLLSDIQQGKGAVLFCSHLGNTDVCRMIAYQDKSFKINVLVHTKHAENFNKLLKQYNPESGLHLFQVTEINMATIIVLAEKIENGELVIIAADRTPLGNSQRVSKVNFLGKTALLPQGPYILASLLQCPVYNLFCIKQSGKYLIMFEHISQRLVLPRLGREQVLQELAQAYAYRLQDICQLAPLQWFNFYDFWQN